jgi:hypothetical protein
LWGEEGCCGTNWPTEVVEIATLREFDEDDSHFRLFKKMFHPKKGTKDGFLRKMPKVIIKLDKIIED